MTRLSVAPVGYCDDPWGHLDVSIACGTITVTGAAPEAVYLPDDWIDLACAGHIPWVTARHPSSFPPWRTILTFATAGGPLDYQVCGHRGPRTAAWLCFRLEDGRPRLPLADGEELP